MTAVPDTTVISPWCDTGTGFGCPIFPGVILSMSRAVRESCDCSSAVRVRINKAKDLTGSRCSWHNNVIEYKSEF